MRAVVRLFVAAIGFWVVLSVAPGPVTGAAKWDPIDPQELAETAPKVEKNADAEVLLWDVRVQDRLLTAYETETNFYHHLRIKIFTDRGRDAQARVDLPHGDTLHIKDLEARVVRRDGTFTELEKKDVFERTIAKAGGMKFKATSFALAAVETGGIIEYRWREVRDNTDSNLLRLMFSRDIPVRLVRYQFVPLRVAGGSLKGRAFQTNPTLKLTTEKGYSVVSMENVPARVEEPHAPPVWETEPWTLIYYGSNEQLDPDEYWLRVAKALDNGSRDAWSPTSGLRRATDSLKLGAEPPGRKLAALIAFCRGKIKRLDADTATDADRRGFLGNKSPGAALDAGRGIWSDAIGVFAAMARAAGLDARVARLPSRDEMAFDRSLQLFPLLWYPVVAVKDGDTWRLIDLRSDHAPAGHLSWAQEGQPALVADKDSLLWITAPSSTPDWSLRSRTATLRLAEDGTLEGDVETEAAGHSAMEFKEQNDHLAPAERETAIKDALASRLPGAEVTGIVAGDVTDPDKTYVTGYHLKVPGYAQRTGSRLFVQPAVFQKGFAPVFAAAQRRHPIFFEYPWKELDRVRIELPAGYTLESADGPAPVSMPPAGGYTMKLATTPDGSSVEMTREFVMGGGQRLQFPVEAYTSVKQFFDGVAKADGHTLTLRKAAGGRP